MKRSDDMVSQATNLVDLGNEIQIEDNHYNKKWTYMNKTTNKKR